MNLEIRLNTQSLDGTLTPSKISTNPTDVFVFPSVQITSTNTGFLPPVMNTAQRNAIASPTAGLIIYNTDTSQEEFYNGSVWGPMGGGSSGPISDADILASAAIQSTKLIPGASANVMQALPNAWSVAGPMAKSRSSFSTITLPNGKVLAAGGFSQTGPSPTALCELFDPATGTWSATGSMNTPRENLCNFLALLVDGTVLAAGGSSTGSDSLDSAEIYDPTTGIWTPTGSMPNFHGSLSIVVSLPDGRALIIGGAASGGAMQAVCDIYDATGPGWTPTGTMNHARGGSAVVLNTAIPGVLVAGGLGATSTAEIFDYSSETWTPTTGNLQTSRSYGSAAVVLTNNNVLLAGGINIGLGNNPTPESEIYDISTGLWTTVGAMNHPRSLFSFFNNDLGNPTVAGGTTSVTSNTDTATVETFDQIGLTWSLLPLPLPTDFGQGSTSILQGGKALLSGGSSVSQSKVIPATQIFSTLVQNVWASFTPSPAGADTQIQYNNAGVLAGSAALEWLDSSQNLRLGDPSNTTSDTTIDLQGNSKDAVINMDHTTGNLGLNANDGSNIVLGGSAVNVGGSGNILLRMDGSASFATSNVTIDNTGVVTIKSGSSATLNLFANTSSFINFYDTPGTTQYGTLVGIPANGGTIKLVGEGPVNIITNDAVTDMTWIFDTDGSLFGPNGGLFNVDANGSVFVGPYIQILGNGGGIHLNNQQALNFQDGAMANIVSIAAPPTLGSSYALAWPLNQGAPNTFLKNDGSGNLDWAAAGGGGGGSATFYDDQFTYSGSNVFTLSNPPDANSEVIFQNGLALAPTTGYTLSGTTLTVLTSLTTGDVIQAKYAVGAGAGGSSVVAAVALTAQNGDVVLNTLFTPTVVGQYRVSVYAVTTTADGGASASPTTQVFYTDDSGFNQVITATSLDITTPNTFSSNSVLIESEVGQPIQYSLTSGGSYGTALYNVYAVVEQITTVGGSGGGGNTQTFTTVTTTTATLSGAAYYLITPPNSSLTTITLPDATTMLGKSLTVQNMSTFGGAILIQTQGGQTIDGQGSFNQTFKFDVTTLVSDGTNWHLATSSNFPASGLWISSGIASINPTDGSAVLSGGQISLNGTGSSFDSGSITTDGAGSITCVSVNIPGATFSISSNGTVSGGNYSISGTDGSASFGTGTAGISAGGVVSARTFVPTIDQFTDPVQADLDNAIAQNFGFFEFTTTTPPAGPYNLANGNTPGQMLIVANSNLSTDSVGLVVIASPGLVTLGLGEAVQLVWSGGTWYRIGLTN